MLEPEVEEGNKEYKRHLINLSDERYQKLISQMKWRLREGDGIAYYYIGVNDDGTIYNLDSKEIKSSITTIKKTALEIDAEVDKIERINIKKGFYFLITIKNKWLVKIYQEKRIILIGESGIGKTTFLAYLIKNKLDNEKSKARNFILNHKHELVTGNSSSINYQYYIYNDIKYIFLDTPGLIQYSKTLNKTLLSCNVDLILYCEKEINDRLKKLYYEYAKYNQIPFVGIYLHSKISKLPYLNMKDPIKQDKIMNWLESKINKNNDTSSILNEETEFILLKTFPHQDLGWILSGFLRKGKIKINQDMIWYEKSNIKVSVKSIHVNNVSVKEITSPIIATICLGEMKEHEIKPKYGFLSSKYYPKNNPIFNMKIGIKWIWKNGNLPHILHGCIDNNQITFEYDIEEQNYYLVNTNINFNIFNKIFISLFEDFMGLGMVFYL